MGTGRHPCLCNGALRTSPGRWRRLSPCIVFLLVMGTVQFFMMDSGIYVTQYLKEKLGSLTHPLMKPKPKGPLRILLVSYPRTGSSFVGDLLQSIPNSFYYFEPLHFLSSTVISEGFDEAREMLHRLFTCNASHVPRFLEWQKSHKAYMKLKRSTNYWKTCSKNNSCYKPDFMDSYCRNHSVVVIKTIRFTLDDAARLFEAYPDLNLKIIYLLRDPRGSMTSRMRKPISNWCKQDPFCINPSKFCSLLARDVNTSCSLLARRPDDFAVIRYEDLSLFPFQTTNRLIKFLGLPFLPWNVEAFLVTHTTVSGKPPVQWNGVAYSYATFRNSSITALKWRQDITFEKLLEFQKQCELVLPLVGYHTYASIGALRSNLNLDANLSDSLATTCSLK